ncbi:hypothetical protein QVH35_08270 [Candidatus Nitrosotenuis chungbukensis]|uniref:hypothetical protein n=1 Tax=Candidatus Nitrosotenuis chungbukensis TaxID=1353246 RepID=UPI0012FF0187|nr:hypothetical protein [Candidatus Nitrosotenuis chungbukensis]WKT57387.1 hypothetical protein QVH35_08270 [Candidatus Nitrosotenuis chungbukensis]
MRIDSCRNCGNALEVKKYCQVCTQPIQFLCSQCAHYADDPIHSVCDLKLHIGKQSVA